MAGAGSTNLAKMNSTIPTIVKDMFAQNRLWKRTLTKAAAVDPMPKYQGKDWLYPNVPGFSPVLEPGDWDGDPTAGSVVTSGVKIPLEVYYASKQLGADTMKIVIKGTMREVVRKATQQALDSLEVMIAQYLGWGLPIFRADVNDNYQMTANATGEGDGLTILTSTDLGALPDDYFNGGRIVIFGGPGMGQCRCIYDFTTTTGLVKTGAFTAPSGGYECFTKYQSALDWETDNDPGPSEAYVATPRNFPPGEYLTADVIMAAEYFLSQTLMAPYASETGYKLYIDKGGMLDLKRDPTFQQIMQNVGGQYFSNPEEALKKGVVGTQVFVTEKVFRSNSTDGGDESDAGYVGSGDLHYYPMVGNDTFVRLPLGVSSKKKNGNINVRINEAPDHTYQRPGVYKLVWDFISACGIPNASNGMNIVARTSGK